MGVYYYLAATESKTCICLGKWLIRSSGRRIQGVYSDSTRRWLQGDDCWEIVERFLLKHQGEPLLFGRDDEIDFSPYDTIEVSQLIREGSDDSASPPQPPSV